MVTTYTFVSTLDDNIKISIVSTCKEDATKVFESIVKFPKHFKLK